MPILALTNFSMLKRMDKSALISYEHGYKQDEGHDDVAEDDDDDDDYIESDGDKKNED